MFRRIWERRQEDDGIAIIMAMALMAMSGVLIVTLVGLAMREGNQTSHNRDRSAAVTTAEGAVDATLAAVQEADVSTLPCGTTTNNAQSVPDQITITTTVKYLDKNGAEFPCPPSETQVAAQIFVKAVATSTPKGGGLPVKREFETLASLKPQFSTDLNKAIFGNAGVAVGNNMDLYGENGANNADVYTNGDFSCTNNEHFRGSVIAPQGSITLDNSCVIDVDAIARNAVNITRSASIVNGNVKVSAGPINLTAGTLVGKAYVTQTSSWCTANPAKCTVTSPVKIPSVQSFPILNGDSTVVAQYQAAGYNVISSFTSCDPSNSGSPGYWLENSASTITQPTLLKTTCRVDLQNNAKTVSLNNDVAIFADRGIEITHSISIQSTVAGTKHQILWVHPYDWQTRVTGPCSNLGSTTQTMGYGIVLSQLVTMSPDVNELLYSPCDINKANQSTVYGQIYSGGIANVSNKTDAYYAPVSVIGVSSTKVVLYYQADILYKRENNG
jgi:hypothetical protein